ncbi:MAG: nucleotidyltransferase domain-containing protein [Phyllobacteriaceae bacterium]|nr:nucleotidyltransferase domain-containing protein [Phyllobacteriaceae bacterium]
MHRDALINRLVSLRPALTAEGVMHMTLFGSRARGDALANSDIDLALEVRPESPFSILDLVGVEQIIADATGLPANAFMRRALDSAFLGMIEREGVTVF